MLIIYYMDLRNEIGKKVKWLLDNESKYLLLVPLTAFALGGAVAYLFSRRPAKRKLVEEHCLVCYNSLREVVLMPCHHLILCRECAKVVRACPLCRQPID